MRGDKKPQKRTLLSMDLEQVTPPSHPLRDIACRPNSIPSVRKLAETICFKMLSRVRPRPLLKLKALAADTAHDAGPFLRLLWTSTLDDPPHGAPHPGVAGRHAERNPRVKKTRKAPAGGLVASIAAVRPNWTKRSRI